MTSLSNHSGLVVVIVKRHGALVDKAAALFAESPFDVIFCKSLYGAVAELALNEQSRQGIVVGTLSELGREGGRFFEICRRYKGTDCLCLIEGRPENNSSVLNKAVRSGAIVIGSVPELEDAFERLMDGKRDANKFCDNTAGRRKDPGKTNTAFKLSKAELEALLEYH